MNPDHSGTTYSVLVGEDKKRVRLDKLLAEALEDFSRSRIKALLEEGRISRANGEPVVDPSYKVKSGEVYLVHVPPPSVAAPRAQDIPLDVIFEDDDLIVFDKPPGLVVHPAAGNPDGTVVNALLHHCRGALSGIGGVSRPGIVHRLDKGTGGLMVAAKNDLAHQGLSRQFADHSLQRAYYAVVWGVPTQTRGEIVAAIGRNPRDRKKMAIVEKGGKHALTRYRVVETFGRAAALIECRLMTGRTHQIRVHMASIGHPIIGDPVYGSFTRARKESVGFQAREALSAQDYQLLYAYIIGFEHPRSGEKLYFERKLPNYINKIIKILEIR